MISKTNQRWVHQHRKDHYFKRAKVEGYPSRAAYKLLEIHQKDKLFKAGMSVVDLGAAPGGWLAVAKEVIGETGLLIAIDLLPMVVPTDVIYIQGDFNDEEVLRRLISLIKEKTPHGQVDLVMSDMAPNISGINSIDQPRSLHLLELAWDCAQKILKPGGSFLAKMFQGEGTDVFLSNLRPYFKHVKLRKPSASRPQSREFYVLACEFLGYNTRS